jgi:pimeloyl-ACP methyl ester carboxylesterase
VTDTLAARHKRFLQDVPNGITHIDDVAWRWYDTGTGPRALVILPGAVGGADLFFVLFEELRERIRVIGLDLPYVEDAAPTLDQMHALLISRGVEQAIFLGASYTGLFVQAYAQRYPTSTRALILSHTGALDPSRAARVRQTAAGVKRMPLALVRGMLRLVVRLLLRNVDQRRFWIEQYDAALAALTRDAMVSRYLLEASIEELNGRPWQGAMLVIHSDNDAIAKPAEQERLRRHYPDAQWHEFTGAGHSSYSRDPIAYAGVVRAFLSALS